VTILAEPIIINDLLIAATYTELRGTMAGVDPVLLIVILLPRIRIR